MRSVWDTLGIAETDDVGAVRSAYARALKQIDMDADPSAYIALREARDHALQIIRYAAAEAAEDEMSGVAAPPPPAPDAMAVSFPEDTFEQHFSALTRLLAGDDASKSPGDETLIRARFGALLGDARMEEVAFRALAETQLANLIATSLPRSHALVAPAISAFGWVGPARIDTPPAIAAILDAAKTPGPGSAEPQVSGLPDSKTASDQQASSDDGDDARARFFAEQFSLLAALLYPQEDAPEPLTPDEQRKASGLFATLLCDPRMELVTFRVGAESQFAHLIAYSIPRSDCIVQRAIDYFDWTRTEGRVDQNAAIAHILNRARGLRFMLAVQDWDHPFHAAWAELTTPLGDKKRPAVKVNASSVYHLLNSIRDEQPLLESHLDPARVAMWEEKLAKFKPVGQPARGSRTGGYPIGLIVFIIISLLSGLARCSNGLYSPPVSTATPASTLLASPQGGLGSLTSVNEDLDLALSEFGTAAPVTATEIREKNPKLYAALEQRWRAARAQQVPRWAFAHQTFKFLSDQFGAMLVQAPRDELEVYWRIERDRLDLQARSAPERCAAYIAGSSAPLPLPSAEQDRLQALGGRLLVEVPFDKVRPSIAGKYVIPGPIIEKGAKQANMSLDDFRSALHGKLAGAAACEARIGLITAVLGTPGKEADRLLRQM